MFTEVLDIVSVYVFVRHGLGLTVTTTLSGKANQPFSVEQQCKLCTCVINTLYFTAWKIRGSNITVM